MKLLKGEKEGVADLLSSLMMICFIIICICFCSAFIFFCNHPESALKFAETGQEFTALNNIKKTSFFILFFFTNTCFYTNAFLKAFNLAIWPDKTHVRRLKVGAKATWEECMELSKLYTFIIKQYPIKTQELLMQSRAFNFYTRDYKKLDFNWLPQITIPGYLLELFDGIYNLRTGKFTPHSDNINMDLVSCSNFWPELTFEDFHGLNEL